MQTKDHWMLAHHMLDRFPEFMDANRRTIQLNVDQKKKQIDHPHYADYEKQLHEVFPEYLEKFKAGLAQKEQHGLDVLHQGYERVCKKHVKAAVDSQFILQAVHDAHLRLFHGR